MDFFVSKGSQDQGTQFSSPACSGPWPQLKVKAKTQKLSLDFRKNLQRETFCHLNRLRSNLVKGKRIRIRIFPANLSTAFHCCSAPSNSKMQILLTKQNYTCSELLEGAQANMDCSLSLQSSSSRGSTLYLICQIWFIFNHVNIICIH